MTFHLAERIAGALSFSASQWLDAGQVLAPRGVPVRLHIHHAVARPSQIEPVLAALMDLLRSPYLTDHWPEGALIVWAGHDDPADARILLLEQWVHDQPYLAYEASFPHSPAVFRGSFSIA